VDHDREGTYLTLPFTMPEDTESFSLAYRYDRHSSTGSGTGGFVSRQEINIIDLGLIAPDGTQVGASGSDKVEIQVSETSATPGYRPCPLTPGEWRIILGAYKVAPSGVTIRYELTFTPKRLRLFKGDLHTHTLASDGVARRGIGSTPRDMDWISWPSQITTRWSRRSRCRGCRD
jgi:hypothetical protein